MTPVRTFLAMMAFMCCLATFAETPADLDPVAVSPDKYRILLENEHVRVVEYTVPPGERDNWHTHPPKVSYVVSAGTLKITTESGESFVVDEPQGSTRWLGAVGEHYGENVGESLVRVVFIEVKSAADESQDLNRYLREQEQRAE